MATKAKNAPKLEDATKEEAAAYVPTVDAGETVLYKDHEGTDRRAIVLYVNPPHLAIELPPEGGKRGKPVPYPESVNLEVFGVAGSGKTRFPTKATRGDEPGQFRAL